MKKKNEQIQRGLQQVKGKCKPPKVEILKRTKNSRKAESSVLVKEVPAGSKVFVGTHPLTRAHSQTRGLRSDLQNVS